MAEPILIFGATGTQGGAVTTALLSAGVRAHAFVRDPNSAKAQALERAGARLEVGDLDAPASISAALRGKRSCYAITTPFEGGAEQETRQGENIVAAAQEAGVPWFIYASVASAHDAEVPHFKSKAKIERSLQASGLAWTILAPSYFYENVLSAREAISEGVLPLALPAGTPLQQVALSDLGQLALAVLAREGDHLGNRIEVAADAPTPEQMASALGVRFQEIPVEELAERKPDLAAMYRFLAEDGYSVNIDALKQEYPRVAWRSFSDWAATALE